MCSSTFPIRSASTFDLSSVIARLFGPEKKREKLICFIPIEYESSDQLVRFLPWKI